MKRRRERKTTRRSHADPDQLGLFEAAASVALTASRPAVLPATAKPLRSASVPKVAGRDGPAVLHARDTAAYLGVSTSTLKAWRRKGLGPPHTMLGARMIGYRVALLDAWLAARTTARRPTKR